MNSLTRKGRSPSNPASRIRAAQNGATRRATVASALKRSREAGSGAAARARRVTSDRGPVRQPDRKVPAEFGASRPSAIRPDSRYRPTRRGSSGRSGVTRACGSSANPAGWEVSFVRYALFRAWRAWIGGSYRRKHVLGALRPGFGRCGSGLRSVNTRTRRAIARTLRVARQAGVTEFPAGIGHKLRPAERYIRATRRITKEGVEYPDGNRL